MITKLWASKMAQQATQRATINPLKKAFEERIISRNKPDNYPNICLAKKHSFGLMAKSTSNIATF